MLLFLLSVPLKCNACFFSPFLSLAADIMSAEKIFAEHLIELTIQLLIVRLF